MDNIPESEQVLPTKQGAYRSLFTRALQFILTEDGRHSQPVFSPRTTRTRGTT